MSKLTLDEAIKHCLEVAEQNETQAQKIGRQLVGSAIDKYVTDCRECAADHRQLAEWLIELKRARAELNRLYPILEHARKLTNEIFEIRKKWQEMK